MVFLDDIFWKLLSDLPATDLLPPAHDWFSISAIFFGVSLMASI